MHIVMQCFHYKGKIEKNKEKKGKIDVNNLKSIGNSKM